MYANQDGIAIPSRVSTRGRWPRLLAGVAGFLIVAGAASAAVATPPGKGLPVSARACVSPSSCEHNARVAEYLLQLHAASSEHNARVAEYLLQLHAALSEHNARVAEHLLQQRMDAASRSRR